MGGTLRGEVGWAMVGFPQQSLHSHGEEAVSQPVGAGSHDSESTRGKAGE